jgi:hypothetical protein
MRRPASPKSSSSSSSYSIFDRGWPTREEKLDDDDEDEDDFGEAGALYPEFLLG